MSSYQPLPSEKAYYDQLFAAANRQGGKTLNSNDAVLFLSRSGLSREKLRDVWNVAMEGKTQMGKEEFYTVLRVVSLAKINRPVSKDEMEQTKGQLLPLPVFKDIPVQVPVQSEIKGQNQTYPQVTSTNVVDQQQQDTSEQLPAVANGTAQPTSIQSQASGSVKTWSMSPAERNHYDNVFGSQPKESNGLLAGKNAVVLFQKSLLPQDILRNVWSLSDIDKDGYLSCDEFRIAMHLIMCVSKRGLQLPESLPAELIPSPTVDTNVQALSNSMEAVNLKADVTLPSGSTSSQNPETLKGEGIVSPPHAAAFEAAISAGEEVSKVVTELSLGTSNSAVDSKQTGEDMVSQIMKTATPDLSTSNIDQNETASELGGNISVANETLQKLESHIKAATDRTRKEQIRIKGEIETLTNERSKLMGQLEEAERDFQCENDKLLELQKEVMALRQQVTNLGGSLTSKNAQTLAVKQSYESLHSERESLKPANAPSRPAPNYSAPIPTHDSTGVPSNPFPITSSEGTNASAAPSRPAPNMLPQVSSQAVSISSGSNLENPFPEKDTSPWADLVIESNENK